MRHITFFCCIQWHITVLGIEKCCLCCVMFGAVSESVCKLIFIQYCHEASGVAGKLLNLPKI